MNENGLNYIDLFAGAGGLSEGFIQSGYRPVAHVEMNEHAAKTIETRIAYYYLKDNGKIKSYYDYEKGKITREQLLEKIPKEELKTVINKEMSEDTIKGIFNTIDDIKREKEIDKIDVIIGGPPCQAYSLVGRAQSSHMIVPMEDDPRNELYVIISSQPIDEIEKFKSKNYSVFDIEPWGIEQVKSLMMTFQISDDTIEDDISSISAYLLKKSQGNALYLSYILRQLRNLDVNRELIDEIPDYDISLSKYYSYLYTKVHNNHTVNALCGADFYLGLNDLMEITGDGKYVEQLIIIRRLLLLHIKV